MAKAGDEKPDMVGKALGLLTLVGQAPHGAGASELARQAGLPFSTAHRLLSSLARDEFIHYDPESHLYKIGLRVFQLGQRAAHTYGFAGSALPVLRQITAQTGESTTLAVRDGLHQLIVNRLDGPHQLIPTSNPGTRGPLHSTAVGKVLVAFAGDESEPLVEQIELTYQTPHTITDRDAFRQEIARVREHGYAIQDQESERQLVALAVPVFGSAGTTVAALAVAAPAFRLSAQELPPLVPVMRKAAEELSARLPQ